MKEEVGKVENKSSITFSMIFTKYYIVILIVSFLSLFYDIIRPAVISTSVIIFIFTFFLFRYKTLPKTSTSNLVYLYIFYIVILMAKSLIIGIPFSIVITDFTYSIIPIIFFFIASNIDKHTITKFEKYFISSVLFLVVVGLIFYYYQPSIYIKYLIEHHHNFETYMNYHLEYPRLHSFVGSVILGTLSSVAFIFSYYRVLDNKGKIYKLLSILFLIAVILSLQRSSWIFTFFSIFYLTSYRKGFTYTLKKLSFFTLLGITLLFIFQNTDLINLLEWRFSMLFDAINERSADWGELFNRNLIEFIIGDGFGSRGHRAMSLNSLTIRDSLIIKMLFEIGVIGFFIFSSIIVFSLFNNVKRNSINYVYVTIIIGILFQAIGSNILDFQIIGTIFWFSIGIITNRNLCVLKNN